jgi:predicted acetyltransferase
MNFPMRPVTEDEWPAFMRAFAAPFGWHPADSTMQAERAVAELDRTLAAFDGDQIVGTANAYTYELTVPGPALVPAAAVSLVAVLPTHRRRGILTQMMRRQLDDVAARGEPLAILHASESGIYGRFGYGAGVFLTEWAIERDHARFLTPAEVPGRLRLVDREEAGKLLPACYDTLRRRTVGALGRSPAYWTEMLADRSGKDGDPKLFYAVHERVPGDVDGFVIYRVKLDAEHGLTRSVLTVRELWAADEQVRAALWRHVFSVDLIHRIDGRAQPVDDPLRWRLEDSRRLRTTTVEDGLWLRVLDVPEALAARSYRTEGRLVLEVSDAFRPAAGGTFELQGGPDGAECHRVSEPADLRLGAAELGAAYLSGVRFGTLARAGRVQELTQGALARADRMFAVDPAPWCNTFF